ncbi:MAG: BNR-4 repeat-containing protein [Candidatus Paceibacterota bacterium]
MDKKIICVFAFLFAASMFFLANPQSSAAQDLEIKFGLAGDIPLGGDFNGDGKTDIAVFRPSDHKWYFDYDRNGTTDATIGPWGQTAGDQPLTGDFNNDGKTDLAIFRKTDLKWYFDYDRNGTTDATIGPWGNVGDIPLSGDFNGDGKIDIAVFRPSDHKWYFDYDRNGTTDATIGPWGQTAGDQPLTGDFNNDGKTDLAIFRATDLKWYFDYDRNGTTDATIGPSGLVGDLSISGDWDNDNKDDFGVFRSSTAGFYFFPPVFCIPNAVSGCRVCKADGSAWVDTDAECAGQKCSNGVCLADDSYTPPGGNITVAVNNGAWCWFQDPRAINYNGVHNRTYIGSVDRSGNIVITQYDHATKNLSSFVLHERLQIDDHNDPTIYVRPDGRLIAFYTKHATDRNIFYRISDNPEDISSWGMENTLVDSVGGVTYTYPVYLSSEKKLYLFYRRGGYNVAKLIVRTSTDQGISWGNETVILDFPNAYPYPKIVGDGVSKIYFGVTGSHPSWRNGTKNIYFAYYQNGEFFSANKSLVKNWSALPLHESDLELVYNATKKGHFPAWMWDIAYDSGGNPYMVFSTYPNTTLLGNGNYSPPKNQSNHYNYARWTGSAWKVYDVTNEAGPYLYESQYQYLGGIELDKSNPSIVYLSRKLDNRELERWTTIDGGFTWVFEPITLRSGRDNLRPVVPFGNSSDDARVVWMSGSYYSMSNYKTSLNMLSQKISLGSSCSAVSNLGNLATEVRTRNVGLNDDCLQNFSWSAWAPYKAAEFSSLLAGGGFSKTCVQFRNGSEVSPKCQAIAALNVSNGLKPDKTACTDDSQCSSDHCHNLVCCGADKCGWGATECVASGGIKSSTAHSKAICRSGIWKVQLGGNGCNSWPCEEGGCNNNVCAALSCVIKTCASLGNYQCGNWSDGCGKSLNCGTCAAGKVCSGGQCVSLGGGGSINPPITIKPAVKLTRPEILVKVNEIIALINKLKAQLAAMTGKPAYSCAQITKVLRYGTQNDVEVKCLQEVLKGQGYALSVSGNYDLATKNAVIKFQQKYAQEILALYGLRFGSGNVGNATMKKINSIIGNN